MYCTPFTYSACSLGLANPCCRGPPPCCSCRPDGLGLFDAGKLLEEVLLEVKALGGWSHASRWLVGEFSRLLHGHSAINAEGANALGAQLVLELDGSWREYLHDHPNFYKGSAVLLAELCL